jgi:pimeloyl-ACP methyl ester carboxylesterase
MVTGRGPLIFLCVATLAMWMSFDACAQQTVETRGENWRLMLNEASIKCRDGDFAGIRGTLSVPEDRGRADSRWIELPIVVVKSLSPNPALPVFRCGGGPGLSNLSGVENIARSEIESHDVVQVGYRGVDGPTVLKHPLLDRLFLTPDLLLEASLRKMGADTKRALEELAASGVDLEEYNIQNVADDIDAARAALGYKQINITGGSFGGAVVYVYSLRYPQYVKRAVIIEAPSPYDIAFVRPSEVDGRFAHLNDLWKKDAEAVKRSPDIVRTMRHVLRNLPSQSDGMPIDSSKVRFITYFGMYFERSLVNMLFDAYVSAEKGDFRSIAVMSAMYDQMVGNLGNVGDLLAKTYCTATNRKRNFVSELSDSNSIIGSPMALMAWGVFQYSGWPVKPVIDEHPVTQKSTAQTLIVYGSKEMGQPFKEKYGDNFTDVRWVLFDDLGHNDIWTITGSGMAHLIRRFIDEGTVDTSAMGEIPRWDFTPAMTFYQMFQQMMQQQGAARQ